MQVSAKSKEFPEAKSVEFNCPDDLQGLTDTFGPEVIASKAKGSIIIDLQAFIRRNLDKSQDELQTLVNEWKPGVRTSGPRKSTFEKVSDSVGSLTPEQRKELLKLLKSQG